MQDAVKKIVSGSKPIGEVVDPRFVCGEHLEGPPEDWDDQVVSTPWAQLVKRLSQRYTAVQGDQLQYAWSALTDASHFARTCGFDGSLAANVLVVTDKDGKRHEFPFDKPLDVPALLAHCSPSPFGDLATHTTRIDASVRAAMELKHKGVAGPGEAFFTLETRSMAGRRSRTWSTIGTGASNSSSADRDPSSLPLVVAHSAHWMGSDVWAPGRSVAALLQKLSIYSPGGHFKRHVDTPVGDRPAMLGTALVALPSAFTGGELVVESPLQLRHHDGTAAAGMGSVTWAPNLSPAMRSLVDMSPYWYPEQMVAFYGDCPHEVKPVKSGHRVTLSFALYERRGSAGRRSDASAAPQTGSASPDAVRVAAGATAVPALALAPANTAVSADSLTYTAALRARADGLVAQVRKSIAASAGKPFALMLHHGYTLSALDEARQHLKGADAVAWSALRAADLGGAIVHLRPVVYKNHETTAPSNHGVPWDKRFQVSSYVYSLTNGEMKALRQGKPLPQPRVKVPGSASVSAAATNLALTGTRTRSAGDAFAADSTAPAAGASDAGAETASTPRHDDRGGGAAAFARRRSVPLEGISFIQMGSSPQVCVERDYQRAGVYTGNEYTEGVDDQVYFAGAIIVIPPRPPTARKLPRKALPVHDAKPAGGVNVAADRIA